MKTVIRALRPDDVEKYADLCAARDGLDRAAAEQRAELVAFMAFNNPTADGEPCYFVGETGDRLTAHMGRMPTWFYAEGQRHLATFAHDLFVHPDLQNAGKAFFVTMRLYQAVERASRSFVAMCWTNLINIKLQQTRKYDQLWADRYVHVLRVDNKLQPLDRLGPIAAPAKAVVGPLGNLALSAIDKVAHRAAVGPRRLERVGRFDKRFDAFAERFGPRMRIAPVKDSAYLNYKYTDRPFIDTVTYAVLGAPEDIVGFVTLRDVSGPDAMGTILELNAARDDRETIAALLGQAIDHYRNAGAPAIECMGTDPAFVDVLRSFLFVARPPQHPFFFANGALYPRPKALQGIEQWHHCYGDSEGPY